MKVTTLRELISSFCPCAGCGLDVRALPSQPTYETRDLDGTTAFEFGFHLFEASREALRLLWRETGFR